HADGVDIAVHTRIGRSVGRRQLHADGVLCAGPCVDIAGDVGLQAAGAGIAIDPDGLTIGRRYVHIAADEGVPASREILTAVVLKQDADRLTVRRVRVDVAGNG